MGVFDTTEVKVAVGEAEGVNVKVGATNKRVGVNVAVAVGVTEGVDVLAGTTVGVRVRVGVRTLVTTTAVFVGGAAVGVHVGSTNNVLVAVTVGV